MPREGNQEEFRNKRRVMKTIKQLMSTWYSRFLGIMLIYISHLTIINVS